MGAEDRFLMNTGASFFVSPTYLNMLKALTRARLEKVTVRKNSAIQGMIYYMVKEGRFGKVINSLPYYGSNPGMLIDHSLHVTQQNEVASRLLMEFRERASEDDVFSATIIQGTFEKEEPYLKYNWDYVDDSRVSAVSILPKTNVLGMFNDKARNQTKKYSDIMRVDRVYDEASLEKIKAMHTLNMQAVRAEPKSKDFFDWVYNIPDSFVYTAYMLNRSEPVAGLICFLYNGVMEYFTPAIDPAFRKYSPMNKIISRAMHDGVEAGARFWNWGGTKPTSQAGVLHFKKQFGPSVRPYKYFTLFKGKTFPRSLLEEYKYFFIAPLDKFDIEYHEKGEI